jgi:hypothetical protein
MGPSSSGRGASATLETKPPLGIPIGNHHMSLISVHIQVPSIVGHHKLFSFQRLLFMLANVGARLNPLNTVSIRRSATFIMAISSHHWHQCHFIRTISRNKLSSWSRATTAVLISHHKWYNKSTTQRETSSTTAILPNLGRLYQKTSCPLVL